jgi:hypothetical protein
MRPAAAMLAAVAVATLAAPAYAAPRTVTLYAAQDAACSVAESGVDRYLATSPGKPDSECQSAVVAGGDGAEPYEDYASPRLARAVDTRRHLTGTLVFRATTPERVAGAYQDTAGYVDVVVTVVVGRKSVAEYHVTGTASRVAPLTVPVDAPLAASLAGQKGLRITLHLDWQTTGGFVELGLSPGYRTVLSVPVR